MIGADQVSSLPHLTPPVLTAYLDTNPANRRNQGRSRGYLTWLKSRGRFFAEGVPRDERALLQQQLRRIFEYLQVHAPRRRGTIIFSGPHSWEFLELQVELRDELQWGRPSLKQLLWILDEHRPVGAVLVKRDAARLFRISFGEIAEERKHAFSIDASVWKRRYLVGPSHPKVGKTKGSQRDAFEGRVTEQYEHFFRQLAKHIRHWAFLETMSLVILAGPHRIIESISNSFPENFRERVAFSRGDVWNLSLSELHARLNPAIKRWERTHELTMVNHLLSSVRSSRSVLGIDNTLAYLQQGRTRQLVIARGLRGDVYQCEKCGLADRSIRAKQRAMPRDAVGLHNFGRVLVLESGTAGLVMESAILCIRNASENQGKRYSAQTAIRQPRER